MNARGAFEIGLHARHRTTKPHHGRFHGDETFTIPEPGLSVRKAQASCPSFLGAEEREAKVRMLPLVLIGGLLPPGEV